MPSRFLTLTQVQRELALTEEQVHRLIEGGDLTALEVLGEWRVERAMLEAFVDRRYAESSAARHRPRPAAPLEPRPPAERPAPAIRVEPAYLTPQQRHVLRLVGEGMSNAEIAAALCVEVSTVKTHVSRLLQRFGLRGREQLIAHAWRNGLLGEPPASA